MLQVARVSVVTTEFLTVSVVRIDSDRMSDLQVKINTHTTIKHRPATQLRLRRRADLTSTFQPGTLLRRTETKGRTGSIRSVSCRHDQQRFLRLHSVGPMSHTFLRVAVQRRLRGLWMEPRWLPLLLRMHNKFLESRHDVS
jgi:hypothetical protein